MRTLATEIITATAVAAGLDGDTVMDAPKKDSALLPRPRLELSYLPEGLTRSFRRIAKFPSLTNPGTHRSVRARLYKRTFAVRATVQADDEAWLESFVVEFLSALPHKTADADGNLVTVTAHRAVRGGFGTRTVEVFTKRSNALHIMFEGMICRDEEIPLILDVNIKDGVTYKEDGDGGESEG